MNIKDEWPSVKNRCPLADGCHALICPLDPLWRCRNYKRDEAICYFVREWLKPDSGFATGTNLKSGPEGQIEGGMEASLRVTIAELVPELRERFPRIDKELVRSAKRHSRRGLNPRKGVGHG